MWAVDLTFRCLAAVVAAVACSCRSWRDRRLICSSASSSAPLSAAASAAAASWRRAAQQQAACRAHARHTHAQACVQMQRAVALARLRVVAFRWR